jgi:hypothetical protein
VVTPLHERVQEGLTPVRQGLAEPHDQHYRDAIRLAESLIGDRYAINVREAGRRLVEDVERGFRTCLRFPAREASDDRQQRCRDGASTQGVCGDDDRLLIAGALRRTARVTLTARASSMA